MENEKTLTLKINLVPYYSSIVLFLSSLAVLLLMMVDIRRGFLFSSDYFRVGIPSVFLRLNAAQLPLLLVGGLGVWLSYRYMRWFENRPEGKALNLRMATSVLAAFIVVFFIIDVFTYRGVSVVRTLNTGTIGPGGGIFGQSLAIPLDEMPGWFQPAGDGINHLLFVWHATMLGILLGSLILVATNGGFIARLKGNGFGAHLLAVAMALPTPFSALCAAPIGSILYRKGASLGPVLAFTVAAPMLNITSLILAAAMLPLKFAILRIVGGIVIAVFLTYFVSLIASRTITEKSATNKSLNDRLTAWATNINSVFSRLFPFDKLLITETPESPSDLILSWMKMAGRLAQVVIPIFLITVPLTAYVVRLMPDTANDLPGIAVTSFFATMLMSPAWAEIAFARSMISDGFPALAATALIALPAVSVPSLIIISGAFGKMRIAVITAFVVFLAGVAAGILFL